MLSAEFRILAFLGGVFAFQGGLFAADSPITIQVRQNHHSFYIQATVKAKASPEAIWEVLTDYNEHARFVPGLTESRVLRRTDSGSIVAQKGWLKVLFARVNFAIEYETTEMPPVRLVSRVLRGNVKRMVSEYRLSADGSGTRIDYSGEVELEGWLQRLVAGFTLDNRAESQIAAILQEVRRRSNDSSSSI